MSPIVIENHPYLVFWKFSGTLSFGSVILYGQNDNAWYSKLWKSKPLFKAAAKIENDRLLVSSGLNNFVLAIRNSTPTLDQVDLKENEDPLAFINKSKGIVNIKIFRGLGKSATLKFSIDNQVLNLVQSSGKQDEYFVPWKHYTVKINVPRGSLLRMLPEDDVSELFLPKWFTTSIELKKGEKVTFLIKNTDMFHILYERRYEETYRLEFNVTE